MKLHYPHNEHEELIKCVYSYST